MCNRIYENYFGVGDSLSRLEKQFTIKSNYISSKSYSDFKWFCERIDLHNYSTVSSDHSSFGTVFSDDCKHDEICGVYFAATFSRQTRAWTIDTHPVIHLDLVYDWLNWLSHYVLGSHDQLQSIILLVRLFIILWSEYFSANRESSRDDQHSSNWKKKKHSHEKPFSFPEHRTLAYARVCVRESRCMCRVSTTICADLTFIKSALDVRQP